MDGSSNVGEVPAPGLPEVSQQPVQPVASVPGIEALPPVKMNRLSIGELLIMIVASLLAVAGISFAVYFYFQWDEAQTNVDGKIAEAEAIAREDERRIAEEVFAEREKEPNVRFTGPADYGSLSFMFPRTWSVFVEKNAIGGGDFKAYMHPRQVEPIGDYTINALRVSIIDRSIDVVRKEYDALVKSGKLRPSVFKNETISGDRFEGEFNKSIVGIMIMFKINDKTAILRTDAMLFRDDFDKLIQTITLN